MGWLGSRDYSIVDLEVWTFFVGKTLRTFSITLNVNRSDYSGRKYVRCLGCLFDFLLSNLGSYLEILKAA